MARQDYADKRDAKKPNATSSRRVQRNAGDVADWEGANPTLLLRAIALVAIAGGALRLGYTRDGGAYSIGIYGDGEPYTEYVRPNEDIDAYLAALIGAWER